MSLPEIPQENNKSEVEDIVEIFSRISVLQSKNFSGPIPPPDILAGYEEVLPDAANRIFKMAETEQINRSRENRHALFNDTLRISGAIIVSLGMIAAGLVCVAFGQPEVGAIIATSGAVVGVIRHFSRDKDTRQEQATQAEKDPEHE